MRGRPRIVARCTRQLSSQAAGKQTPSTEVDKATADEMARWALKLNIENTHLSWSRNGIISTIAGVGMFQ